MVDVIHEEYRNPTMYYCDKAVCMAANFLGAGAWHASKPTPLGFMSAIEAKDLCVAAVAALTTAAAFVAMKRK